jgi:hypothetical protein
MALQPTNLGRHPEELSTSLRAGESFSRNITAPSAPRTGSLRAAARTSERASSMRAKAGFDPRQPNAPHQTRLRNLHGAGFPEVIDELALEVAPATTVSTETACLRLNRKLAPWSRRGAEQRRQVAGAVKDANDQDFLGAGLEHDEIAAVGAAAQPFAEFWPRRMACGALAIRSQCARISDTNDRARSGLSAAM